MQSFRASPIYAIVAVAAFTGMRRNEILALRWCDLDPVAKTLRIERSLEESRGAVQRFKSPKREAHKRTIAIDDALVRLLLSVREKHLRLVAGVPDGVEVDLQLIKLPADALMFPSPIGDDLAALAVPAISRDNSSTMPAGNTRGFDSMICAAVTKRRYLIAGSRFMWSLSDAAMMRRRC